MISCKRAYKIYKDNIFKGYLLGSLHKHMNPLEFEQLQTQLATIVGSVNNVFIECNLPHHSTLQYGVERAVLATVEACGKNSDLYYFESLMFQHAMLNSCVWVGDRIVRLPWLKYNLLTKNPTFWFWASKMVAPFLRIYNTVYNLLTGNKHTKAVQDFAAEQHDVLIKIIQAYAQGDALALSRNDSERFLLEPRNCNKVAIIAKNLVDACIDGHTSLYVVGAAHLPGKSGVVELLSKEGYRLEPWDLM